MTRTLDIEPGEHGHLRLFTVSLDDAALTTRIGLDQPADTERPFVAAASDLLNQPALDLRNVELFDLADLAGLGLPGYLATAYDIPEDQIAPQRAKLTALDGFVLLLLSEALPGPGAVTLDPALTLIASFETPQPDVSMTRLSSDVARGTLAPPAGTLPQPEGRNAPRGVLIIAALIAAVLLLWAASALVL